MIKKYCLFLIFAFFIVTNYVHGYSQSTSSSHSGETLYPDAPPCDSGETCCNLPIVTMGATTIFSVNVYDLNGKFISSDSTFISNKTMKFTAGTPVILDIREEVIVPPVTVIESHAYYRETGEPAPEHDAECQALYPVYETSDGEDITVNTGVHKVTYYDENLKPFVISGNFTSQKVSNGMNISSGQAYNIPRTCLHRKTGKVRYITSSSQPCEEEEIDVNELFGVKGRTVYFIPLKLKSSDSFGIKIETLEGVDSLTNWTFDGGVNKWNFIIPVKQNFYHEVKGDNNKLKFKGYEFFTRQINPKKPFPNGINECSYWDSKKSGDYIDTAVKSLGSSFKNLNYSFKVGNVPQATLDANRKYNDEHLYTDWSDMNINGWSKNLIHGSDVKTGSTYALGCGPALKKYKNFDEVCDIK